MEIFIDGDGCPVIEETERAAALYGLKVIIFCDTSHLIHSETSRVMVVDKGRDAADWAIISAAHPGDVVITQDYGLASRSFPEGPMLFIRTDGSIPKTI